MPTRYEILSDENDSVQRDRFFARKLRALLQGGDLKVYQDIAAILRSGLSLKRGFDAATTLDPNFPECEVLKTLVFFNDPKLEGLSADDRATLIAHAVDISARCAAHVTHYQLSQSSKMIWR